ncbi:MAG TPA: hypothetical protein VFP35_01735 [Candidatus Saccharimonadales bacterium]|nr:hypothetical protein [Candidatus Saccharimonadales bacterium]
MHKRRGILRAVVLACLLVAVLALTGGSGLARTTAGQRSAKFNRAQVRMTVALKRQIVSNRRATWRWQTLAGRPLSRTTYSERRESSLPYLRWTNQLWRRRLVSSRHFVRHLLSAKGYLPPARARQLGRVMAATMYGWTGQEWHCLDRLWGHYESGWDVHSDNPNSPAYGIPQADPGSKMANAGRNWWNSAFVQIKWGLRYIARHRPQFHTPCQAVDYHLLYHAY